MRKKILAVCFIVSLACFVCSVAQADQWYTSGHVGVTFANDADVPDEDYPPDFPDYANELDTGYGFLVALGYDFDGPRVEAELGYQNNSFDSFSAYRSSVYQTYPATGDLSVLSMMINGYYDFHNTSAFTPYLTAGLGFAYVEWSDFSIPETNWVQKYDFDDTVFAYQFGAGVEYAINESLAVDLRYRYFGTEDVDVTALPYWGSTEAEFSSHNIYLGLRYFF